MLEYAQKCTILNYKKDKFNKLIKKKIEINSNNQELNSNVIVLDTSSQQFQNSINVFKSSIAYTDWYEAIQNQDALGLLVKINSLDLMTKLGFEKNLHIENITTTFMPVKDMINVLSDYFINKQKYGNINFKSIIQSPTFGECNSVIPLYINKYHWKIAKNYIKPMLGLAISHNPMCYNNNYIKYLFTIFAGMMCFTFKPENINEQWLTCLIVYLRTCAEICFENGYNRGIVKYVDTFISKNIISIFDYDKIISQTICVGYVLDDDKIKLLLETILKRLDLNELESHLELLVAYYKMNMFMKVLLNKVNNYNNFIKLLESNYGVLPNDILVFLVNEMKIINKTILNLI